MVTWDANAYHHSSAAQRQWAEELLAKLALDGKEHVLDIGCGDGKITAAIAERLSGGSVVGVDSSAEMIAFARQAFPPEQHAHLSFQQMDARELAFTAEFDVVFSNAALHWVVDHRPVLQGIARALQPGGRCLLQMGGHGNAAPFFALLTGESPVYRRWQRYLDGMAFPYGFYTPDDYRPWLAQAGLRPRRIELLPRDMRQPGAEGLAAWVRTTWLPFTQRIPADKREGFITDVVTAYLARHPLDAEGYAHVPMARLEVDAVKA